MSYTAWSLVDWNKHLLHHFFGLPDEDVDDPVFRVLLTPEELVRVVGGSSTPDAVRRRFVGLLRDRLHKNGCSLGTDALRLSEGWSSTGDAAPPFLVHLLFTCFASADSDVEVVDSLNFRRRLTGLLGGGIHHGLEKLVPLWKALSTWLVAQRSKGRRLRELPLPDVGHLTIIGYSVRLAFPTYRDQARLLELLSDSDADTEPPPREVIRAVTRELSRFSNRFRVEFVEFRRKFGAGDADLYETAFWAAVRHAARVSHVRCAEQDRIPRLGLGLEPDLVRAGGFVLILLAEEPIPGTERYLRFHALAPKIDRFAYAVTSTSGDGEGYEEGVHLLLSGGLRDQIPRIASLSLMRTIAHGVLLFERVEGGVYVLRGERPEGADVAVLVKKDLSRDFVAACREVSTVVEERDALYSGWREIHVGGDAIARAQFDRFTAIRHVPCLQEVLRSSRPRIVGGVRIDNAWLGRSPRLPDVVVDAERVVAVAGDSDERGWPVRQFRLIRDPGQPNLWRFPSMPAAVSLEGKVTVIASRRDREVRTTGEFVTNVLGHEYPQPANPSDWLMEAAAAPVAIADEPDLVTRQVNDAGGDLEKLRPLLKLGVPAVDGASRSYVAALREDEICRLDNIVEILAGLGLQRRGLQETEFLGTLHDVFELRGQLLYDVARAWIENGFFDRLIYRRWRGVVYFARRPRLIAHPYGTGLRCVLEGLGPSVVRQRLIRAMAGCGGERHDLRPRSPWVPARIAFVVSSFEVVERVSEQVELAPPRVTIHPERFVFPIDDVVSRTEAELPNYQLVGQVDPLTGRLHRGAIRRAGETVVEWYSRPDLPDYFVVHRPGRPSFKTLSRTWALLAALASGDAPFESSGRATLHRSFGHSTYLPLPAARLASILGGAGPDAALERAGDYSYDFGFPEVRGLILDRLWNAAPRTRLDASQHARLEWLMGRLSADPRVRGVAATLRQQQSKGSLQQSLLRLVPRVPPSFRGRLMHMVQSLARQD